MSLHTSSKCVSIQAICADRCSQAGASLLGALFRPLRSELPGPEPDRTAPVSTSRRSSVPRTLPRQASCSADSTRPDLRPQYRGCGDTVARSSETGSRLRYTPPHRCRTAVRASQVPLLDHSADGVLCTPSPRSGDPGELPERVPPLGCPPSVASLARLVLELRLFAHVTPQASSPALPTNGLSVHEV